MRQPTLSVVAAVFLDGDRVLACRRRPDRSAGGKWEFPGGKVEPGESPQAALVREIDEELGVRVEVGELLDRSAAAVDQIVVDLACYRVHTSGPAPERSSDHDRLAWVPCRLLRSLDWAEPDLPMVDRLVAA